MCRAGQPGMGVARWRCSEVYPVIAAFSRNGTANPDSVVLVVGETEKPIEVSLEFRGSTSRVFDVRRSSRTELYSDQGAVEIKNDSTTLELPPCSVTTLLGQ
jgi:hypothetical protein